MVRFDQSARDGWGVSGGNLANTACWPVRRGRSQRTKDKSKNVLLGVVCAWPQYIEGDGGTG